MDWRIASFSALGIWTVYTVFMAKSTEIHGEKVGMFFEAGAFILLSLLSLGHIGDFARVTVKSAVYASLMALGSAGGMYLLLYAVRVSPKNEAFSILISGMFPVVAVLVFALMGKSLVPHQWIGVILAFAGLVLVNWPK